MEPNEDKLDKVRISEEESYKLDGCFDKDGLPSSLAIDYDYLTAAISIEEALYKLSRFGSNYIVECEEEVSFGSRVRSFYLVNRTNPNERHWIVYNKPNN